MDELPQKTKEELVLEMGARKIYEFVKSDGWTEIRQIFIKRLAEINNLSGLIEGVTFEETVKQALINKSVVAWVIQVLQEIEGISDGVEYKRELEEKVKEEAIFINLENK